MITHLLNLYPVLGMTERNIMTDEMFKFRVVGSDSDGELMPPID